MKIEVLTLVKFNSNVAMVLRDEISYKYTKYGDLIIGTDQSGTFVRCYEYNRPSPGFFAFAGTDFDISLENGEIIHCYGQWWDGGYKRAAKILGCELVHVAYRSLEELKKCYVFIGTSANKDNLTTLINGYQGKVYRYKEYRDILNCT